MRSPAALAASLFCLASAMLLAGILVQDDSDAEPLHSDDSADAVRLEGELERFQAPESWTQVRGALEGTTYRLDLPANPDLVLLTGMEPGWDHHEVVADATLVLEAPHPEEAGHRVLVFRLVESPTIG